MQIEIGKYYVNKTWRFLLPCLRGHGDSFVSRFQPLFKLAVGIHDTLLDGSDISKGRNIYIMIDKLYKPDLVNAFMNWVKYQEYYKGDYCPDSDFVKSRKIVIIIEVPKMFNNAYDMFLKGRYSKMYSPEHSKILFSHPDRKKELDILNLSPKSKEDFIGIIRDEFDTNISITDFDEPLKELELPLKTCEEIFNCNENQRVFFVEELDKVWEY